MAAKDDRERFNVIVKVLVLESALIVGVLLLLSGIVAYADIQGLIYALVGYAVGSTVPTPLNKLLPPNSTTTTTTRNP